MSYHNEHTHFCRKMCNYVNTRLLRPYGVITEIMTKSPQKLYNESSFSPHFTQKSSFYPLKSFLPQVLKIRFHLWKHCIVQLRLCSSFHSWSQWNSPLCVAAAYQAASLCQLCGHSATDDSDDSKWILILMWGRKSWGDKRPQQWDVAEILC